MVPCFRQGFPVLTIGACRVCGCYVTSASGGRPASTCSVDCRLIWKSARARAKRSQERALASLRIAAVALAEVEGPYKDQTLRIAQRLSEAAPSRLARIVSSERDDWTAAL